MADQSAINPLHVTARALVWREPAEDELGHEDVVAVAPGIGGEYSITPPKPVPEHLLKHGKPGDHFLLDGKQYYHAMLWWADDPFTFDKFESVEAAKLAAEADWQTKFRAMIAA